MNECDFVESTEYGEYCALYDKACDKNECEVMKHGLGGGRRYKTGTTGDLGNKMQHE